MEVRMSKGSWYRPFDRKKWNKAWMLLEETWEDEALKKACVVICKKQFRETMKQAIKDYEEKEKNESISEKNKE